MHNIDRVNKISPHHFCDRTMTRTRNFHLFYPLPHRCLIPIPRNGHLEIISPSSRRRGSPRWARCTCINHSPTFILTFLLLLGLEAHYYAGGITEASSCPGNTGFRPGELCYTWWLLIAYPYFLDTNRPHAYRKLRPRKWLVNARDQALCAVEPWPHEFLPSILP